MTASESVFPAIASAPGKIVLSGEYAVLDGAAAIAMAVDRRASVSLQEHGHRYCDVTAVGYSDEVARFDVQRHPLQWLDGGEPYSLLESVWNTLPPPRQAPGSMQLDTRAFVDEKGATKLGLGSSAALCVALATGLQGDANSLAETYAAHKSFQGGIGSGVDVACSIHGGLLRYAMKDREVMPLRWPQKLYYRILWSGVAANTRSKLQKLGGAATAGSASAGALRSESNRIADIWQSGDAQSVVDAYSEYCSALQVFDNDHDLGIYSGGHAEMHSLATDAGLTYKPCGAGGGDIGILLALDDQALNQFVSSNTSRFVELNCQLEIHGARLEVHADA